ncbi:metallophosphoesterase [Arcticibacterium luteifluviistationis]|uniref:Metallophosphoesterase n=1 Tax=Arcticibacterium luteifluviistationis TaxID=1784714 RepID=A0A2Z4G7L3_9BACT|nr:metallophosphoesterase [Arcticibacterium luteifluviistationis]AWV97152.1 metallophosphoesterase [Arcticibacterium luteifluviistationis]
MKRKFTLLFSITFLLLSSCANYKTKYASTAENWELELADSTSAIAHSMYLIGDAGYSAEEKPAPAVLYLKKTLAAESANSSVIFLGDNIYQSGMPPKANEKERAEAEFRIEAQLSTIDDFAGYPLFLPGNHDWRGWGVDGLKRQEKYVQKYINKKRGVKDKDDYENYFLPSGGCSGPEVVELNDDVVILAIDSQWWLTDWNKVNEINDGCELKNREHFIFEFENIARKYRNKRVVIAMHHPLYTYGPHGGRFTAKEHLFPLTELNPNLYIPLPGLGSLSALVRGTIGSRQDVVNKNYIALKKALLAGAGKNGSFIFASGHEHNLQYIENAGQKFIVSGSGSKKSPVGKGKGSLFSSSRAGFSKLDFYKNGETWVTFYEVAENGEKATVIYRKLVKGVEESEEEEQTSVEYKGLKESTLQYVTTKEAAEVGPLHGVILGKHNRELFQKEYTFRTFDLSKEKGGLEPVKLGGGNQTNSLRLIADDDKQYVLRGLAKDVTRFLPAPFNELKAAQFVVEDNFMSTNPFAPLAIPILADAIQVYHTNPTLVYVPAQAKLGDFNEVVGETMNLFEERPNGKQWEDAPFFGNADKILNTKEVLEEILEENDSKVDESWMLRTRLFDFLIGDWDRHDDQWAWAVKKMDDGKKRIRPIPKDRDQAFSLYDGLVTEIAKQTMPFLRQLQSFEPDVKNVKWTTWSARLVDRTFLNGLDWNDWEEQIQFIQENLSDEIIDKAFDSWPEAAQKAVADELKFNVKSRRDNLENIAREHYEFVSSAVNVIGTDEREHFVIDRKDDETVQVIAFHISKKGNEKEQIYDRTFKSAITKEINIYGNDDDDEFTFIGPGKGKTKVRVIGGTGKDVFNQEGDIPQSQKKSLIYDDEGKKNKVKTQANFKDKRTDNYLFNIYDRRSNDSNYDMFTPFPIVGYNGDEGFSIGASASLVKYGFKKKPYASLQKFNASLSFSTNALRLGYEGDFVDVFRPIDLFVKAHYNGPGFALNYAGIGNDTRRVQSDLDFYRVFQESAGLHIGFKKRLLADAGSFTIGPFIQTSKIKQIEGSYLTGNTASETENVFRTMAFAGAKAALNFDNIENAQFPTNGVKFNTDVTYSEQFETSKNYTAFSVDLALYKALDTKERIVLATQASTSHVFGKGYEFFQLASIGGLNGLRGYRRERFYGENAFRHTTDLRLKLSRKQFLLSYGLYGSFDYGKVWDERTDENWHYSYGGGLWFSPMNLMLINVGIFVPKETFEESHRFTLGVGFDF